MARLFIEGFESGGSDQFSSQNLATVTANSSGLWDGNYYLDLSNSASFVSISLPSAISEIYSAFMFSCATAVQPGMIAFYSNSTPIAHVTVSTSGYINAYVSTSTGIAQSSIAIAPSTIYHFEVYFKMNDSGTLTVKLNGITIINYSGDTKPGTDSTFNNIRFGAASLGSGGCAYDNIVLESASWVGRTKIQALYPTGAGTTTQWTASIGNNYAAVDEVPASDTDFISTNTVNVIDTYGTSNLVGTIGSIKSVMVQARVFRQGLSTPTNVQMAVRSNATNYFSASIPIPTVYATVANIWETDPATSAAWIEANVNNMEIGIKSVA